MRRIATLAVTALLLAGCGTQTGGDRGDSGDSVSPSPSPSSSGCTSVPVLHAADSGRTVCLAVGGTVRVALDGAKNRPWTPVTAEGSGLEAANSGIVLLPGDANAAFEAVSAGTVRLGSSRPLCATETGKVSCKGIQDWSVTVVIT
ncbi:hypothetical protein OG864_19255 [Streptomyces sp. NBC_00124]|uniref:hypothetical protein n=1 Tax=Streptomyces sp. NBC_00124 TaxID=2975662 RepID=UPI00224D9785|nr:hypothetical protein [Streptomyces sp. NBC_00124]MCX5360847.1 hypothetical protein [Streptomyces sp. NBC_00124]